MSRIQILNEIRYPLPVTDTTGQNKLLTYHRWEHRATLGKNAKEYMVFLDNGLPHVPPTLYIEKVQGGHSEKIIDDELFNELYRFAEENKLIEVLPPISKLIGE